AAVEKEFAGKQYGAFKGAVAEAVIECLRPVQQRYAELAAEPAAVDARLGRGAATADQIAEPVLDRAMRNAGLLRRVPGGRILQVGRAVLLARDLAEVLAAKQHPADGQRTQHHGLPAAVLDVEVDPDARRSQLVLRRPRVLTVVVVLVVEVLRGVL